MAEIKSDGNTFERLIKAERHAFYALLIMRAT